MKLTFKPEYLRRYKQMAQLLWKYGRSDLVQQSGLAGVLNTDFVPSGKEPNPEELASDLEEMGPTFIKLGQLLSSRIDLLPSPYVQALARLQDDVKPFSYEEVERIVSNELGARVSKGFAFFEEKPLATASLGQVHRAALRDGRPVVVKVQRPGIREQIMQDLEALEQIAAFLDKHTEAGQKYQIWKAFDELRQTLVRELDYQREAANLRTVAENLRGFEHIRVPLPVDDYTSSRVLTMDYVEGTKVTKISPLTRIDTDGSALAEELFKAYLKQVLVDGLFHADPHPGNVFLTDEGCIALLDLGMVGRVAPSMQEHLIKVLLAVSEGRSDEACDTVLSVSETRFDFDESEFRRKASRFILECKNNNIQQLNIGAVLMELSHAAGSTGMLAPPELTMLGKALLSLDQVGRILDPDFNPNAAVRRHVMDIMKQRMLKSITPSNLLSAALEMKDFASNLPGHLNKILDAIANAELELKIKTTDAHTLLDGFQKIANRIAAGLILASLIIGASILMNIQTSFRLLGYPGLAILCFMAAAGGGFWLLFNIFFHDYKSKKHRSPPY